MLDAFPALHGPFAYRLFGCHSQPCHQCYMTSPSSNDYRSLANMLADLVVERFQAGAEDVSASGMQWANTGVFVDGKFYALARLYFAARNPDEPETMESPQPPPMANGSALNEVLEAAAAANAIAL